MTKVDKVAEKMFTQIMKLLEKGKVPWRKTWAGGTLAMPKNPISGTRFRGINIPILLFQQEEMGYTSGLWATYKQWRDKCPDCGYEFNRKTEKLQDICPKCEHKRPNVRKGEKSTSIYFPCWFPRKDAEGKVIIDEQTGEVELRFGGWRYHNEFNVAQVDNYPQPPVPVEREPRPISEDATVAIEAVMPYLKHEKIDIVYRGRRSAYSITNDSIKIPRREDFENDSAFANTLFHEVVHSTGTKERCKRKGVMGFDRYDTHKYSEEELVAEFGASFMCGITEVSMPNVENSAAYIQHWVEKLKSNKKILFSASSQAQYAMKYVLKHTDYLDD